jgi:hypothetical protein
MEDIPALLFGIAFMNRTPPTKFLYGEIGLTGFGTRILSLMSKRMEYGMKKVLGKCLGSIRHRFDPRAG